MDLSGSEFARRGDNSGAGLSRGAAPLVPGPTPHGAVERRRAGDDWALGMTEDELDAFVAWQLEHLDAFVGWYLEHYLDRAGADGRV